MIAARAARFAVDMLSWTWELEVRGGARYRAGEPVILAVWHGQLLPALCRHRGEPITLLVSRHADGEYLASAARSWGFETVRGSSTRGSVSGLRGLVRALRAGRIVAVTPDGPRGPARRPKAGALAAAQLTGAAIIPVGTAANRTWRLRSWDRFELPRPFARVRVAYGTPIHVGPGADGLEAGARDLAVALDGARDEAACGW